jgi:Brp/Blh family beta-carotene 15,15'-monooxygenase
MQNADLSKGQIVKFFVKYILTILGFLALWLTFPLIAFIIFILISSYHFGQSNWENIDMPKKYSLLLNIFWGAFAVGGPVLWHWYESKLIIAQVVGSIPDVSMTIMSKIQIGIIVINSLIIFLLKYYQTITSYQFQKELGKLFVLSSLFYFTPMLVGFAMYFGLWHSLSSLMSQFSFIKKQWPGFSIRDYYRQATPYTVMAVFGFVIMVIGHPYILPEVSIISTFLIFIACVTLPHIILVEESYSH